MNESQFPYDKLNLQLGDIIKFNSPTDTVLHDKEHIIEYIDNSKIQLINEKAEKITLKMDDFGKLNNESIINIDILNRLSSPSYAIQKGYILGKWLDLYFTGDVPFIVTLDVLLEHQQDGIQMVALQDIGMEVHSQHHVVVQTVNNENI